MGPGGLGNALFVAGMPGTGKTATAHEVRFGFGATAAARVNTRLVAAEGTSAVATLVPVVVLSIFVRVLGAFLLRR